MDLAACTCSRYNAFSLLDRWQCRVEPLVRRALKRGHRVDPRRLGDTAALIVKLADKDPTCFASEHANRALHLKDCPWHPSNRIDTVSLPLVDSQQHGSG